MKPVTIDDVAKKAGVSIKTVSRVVNREPNVRAATKEKVEEAIKELGYRPNPSARGLAGRRSYIVGLLYDNPSPQYLAHLHAGVMEACLPRHYGLALSHFISTAPDLADNVRGWLRQAQIDGVVLTPPLSDHAGLLETIKAMGVPSVVVSSKGPGDIPSVVIDEEAAAYQMTKHLIDVGHKDIAFIIGHPDHYASALRLAGFRRAMKDAGLSVPDGWVRQGYFDFASGREAAQVLLSGSKRPSAIFASNDDMAAGVLYEAHARKLLVPDDIAIAGFDDTPLSRQVWPGLTTVRQPIRSIGETAGQIVLDAIAAGGLAAADAPVTMAFELKFRGSTGEGADL
ncbi:LacI family DNA-binding transcriptional regulator [Kordiimonas marina]|uniref:LacI family DNA-binding transcriptional regulator n=1 Tax=Kordiimonas marina TaxID=2872312 RepID=UPI001FF43220|nr:LacI family DNA-binding transcriptional regulator [Kordiimonas marina]MCJ9430680.1 LacI family DNA-binding transcriptional regulator [Kordiimonas marina]